VRIRERKPVAFVNLRSEFLLIDADGVLLEIPPKTKFAFPVLTGIRESETEDERRGRVALFLRVENELGYLMRDVSEVSVADPGNVRLVAQVDNLAVELAMGDGNFARRYQNFASSFPEIRKRSPEVKTFDLRLDDRITAKE
jgi:cell division septal protein FtsQ